MTETIPYKLPERLKVLRKRKKISQETLARNLGVSQSSVAGWETRKAEPPGKKILEMAALFGCSVDYLMGAAENPLREVTNNTPYEQVTPFERRLLDVYRRATEGEQVAACRVLGLEHPAEARLRAKRA